MSFVASRIKYIGLSYGYRINRFIFHLLFIRDERRAPLEHWFDWFLDVWFYLADLFLLPDVLDLLHNGFKSKRTLSEWERQIAIPIFQEEIYNDQVYITEKTIPFKANLYFAYVSFNTINCIKEIPYSTLIHELVHIWQYQRYGSVYIYRALKAQNSKAGYDYGGSRVLIDELKNEYGLLSFNFEQQAEIIEDYYGLSIAAFRDPSLLKIYESYVRQLHYKKATFVA